MTGHQGLKLGMFVTAFRYPVQATYPPIFRQVLLPFFHSEKRWEMPDSSNLRLLRFWFALELGVSPPDS